jgi:acyl-CoA hydrolase
MAADSIGNYLYSGFGGQVDFIYGAACVHALLAKDFYHKMEPDAVK